MVDELLTAEELRGNAEDRVNELSLADRIALRKPADLAFSDLRALPRSPQSYCMPRPANENRGSP